MKSFKLSCVLCLPLFFMSCAKDKAAAEEVVSELKKFLKCTIDKVNDFTPDLKKQSKEAIEKSSLNADDLANNCTKQELKDIKELYTCLEKECQKMAPFSLKDIDAKKMEMKSGSKCSEIKVSVKCSKLHDKNF